LPIRKEITTCYFVKPGDRIWAEIENADSTYEHGIAVTLIVEKKARALAVVD